MDGEELFRETDAKFTYWYADGYGIHASFDKSAYQYMSIEDALKVMSELSDIIRYCQQHRDDFGDL